MVRAEWAPPVDRIHILIRLFTGTSAIAQTYLIVRVSVCTNHLPRYISLYPVPPTGDRLVNGPFRIDPNSGILTLEGQMDKSKVSYKLNITATDNGRCCGRKMSRSSRGLVIVEVKDINNNAPRFPECGNYHPSVAEGEDVGTSVIQVSLLFFCLFFVFFSLLFSDFKLK